MKKLLYSLVFTCLFFLPPVFGEDKPYLAVYCNPGFESEWQYTKPDLLWEAKDWEDFDEFLDTVKRRAGHRRIELDIDSHGDKTGLYLQYIKYNKETSHIEGGSYRATFGYICNLIDTRLDPRKVTVYSEACYAAVAYVETIRSNAAPYQFGGTIQDHPDVPIYPIYGESNIANWGNSIYLGHKYGVTSFFSDIRQYETKILPPMDENDQSQANMSARMIWAVLRSYDEIRDPVPGK